MRQRTDEWHAARLGKVTASRVADVIAKIKSGYGASRATYKAELLVERLTGKPTQGFVSAAMQHGIDTEDEARAAYEFDRGVSVVEVGFIDHPIIAMSGASPDGYVGDSGMVEIKCPQPAGHLETLRTKAIPAKYFTQMQWQMACAGRDWCDFISYQPDLAEAGMGLFIQRVHYDGAYIKELASEVQKFLGELDVEESALRAEYGKVTA